jgi:nitrogen fixation NifU-like protein
MGFLDRPDGEAERVNSCGDVMRIQVKLAQGVVTEAASTVQGCATALACASAAAALARGRTAADIVRRIDPQSIVDVLDGLPDDHLFLAEQAADTLRGAVMDALLSEREEWKKPYRS